MRPGSGATHRDVPGELQRAGPEPDGGLRLLLALARRRQLHEEARLVGEAREEGHRLVCDPRSLQRLVKLVLRRRFQAGGRE
jgi:hypothetical protein